MEDKVKTVYIREGLLLQRCEGGFYSVVIDFALTVNSEEDYCVTIIGYQGSPKVCAKGLDIGSFYDLLTSIGVLKHVSKVPHSLEGVVKHGKL